MRRLLAVVVIIAGCGSSTVSAQQQVRASYGVLAEGCSLVPRLGSGVALDDDLIVTAAHTVAGAMTIKVIDIDGEELAADIAAIDKDTDLAVLRIGGSTKPLELGEANAGEIGWLLSWSPNEGHRSQAVSINRRLRITIEDIYTEGEVERLGIEIQGSVTTGDSGGAVVDADGRVVGIVYAGSREREVGFAVRREEIDQVLASVGSAVPDLTCVP